VRYGHRDRVQPDGQPDAEPGDEASDGRAEPFPLQVRLGAGEQQERPAGGVADGDQPQAWLVVALPVVLDEHHDRPAGAVVQQLVDVERDDSLRVGAVEQVVAGQPSGVPGVDEAGQPHDEDRLVQRWDVVDFVQLVRVEHGWHSSPRRLVIRDLHRR